VCARLLVSRLASHLSYILFEELCPDTFAYAYITVAALADQAADGEAGEPSPTSPREDGGEGGGVGHALDRHRPLYWPAGREEGRQVQERKWWQRARDNPEESTS
jgi:hypothetical protein